MSDIPFEIQMEIVKKVYDVKSLVQFRSVSKPWKCFIDCSDFIKGFGARHTQPHSRIIRYKSGSKNRYICLVVDYIQTFKVQLQQTLAVSAVSPLLKQMISYVVGTCHGLVCLFGYHNDYKKRMVVIWNPSIRKSFGIDVPYNYHPGYQTLKVSENQLVFGFGVCPVTRDPTVVKIIQTGKKPWYVEVFTLSSGVWNVIPSSNLPRQSIKLIRSAQVVIDKFIYWGAWEPIFADDGGHDANHMIVSFDLIKKEFKVVNLPDTLTNEVLYSVQVSKLRGSLVVSTAIMGEGTLNCGVWVMEHDLSFRKLFTIGAHVSKILGFGKSGETIFEIQKEGRRLATLARNQESWDLRSG